MRTRLRDAAVSINQHCMGRVPAVTENEPRGSRTRRNGMPLYERHGTRAQRCCVAEYTF